MFGDDGDFCGGVGVCEDEGGCYAYDACAEDGDLLGELGGG